MIEFKCLDIGRLVISLLGPLTLSCFDLSYLSKHPGPLQQTVLAGLVPVENLKHLVLRLISSVYLLGSKL